MAVTFSCSGVTVTNVSSLCLSEMIPFVILILVWTVSMKCICSSFSPSWVWIRNICNWNAVNSSHLKHQWISFQVYFKKCCNNRWKLAMGSSASCTSTLKYLTLEYLNVDDTVWWLAYISILRLKLYNNVELFSVCDSVWTLQRCLYRWHTVFQCCHLQNV